MVYGYMTDREFIHKTQILLDKLEKKGVWNKDTLVVGLDKSVRPLAYTIRKLSKEEGKETPDIRFLNYSAHGGIEEREVSKISDYLKKNLNPEKLSKYNKVLILDEHIASGSSLGSARNILSQYFTKPYHIFKKNKLPEIHIAALGTIGSERFRLLDKTDFISLDDESPSKESPENTGIERKGYPFTPHYNLRESRRVKDKAVYKEFIQNRKQLSEDIHQYIQERNEDNESSPIGKSLEKAVQMVSVIAFFGGIILSYKSITGNIIGSSGLSPNILGIFFFILGFLGLIIYKRFKR